MQEIVLKQQGVANKLSLVVGDNLFQMVKHNVDSGTNHEFSIARKSINGFKHRNFQILRDWRPLILFLCFASFIFTVPIKFTINSPAILHRRHIVSYICFSDFLIWQSTYSK